MKRILLLGVLILNVGCVNTTAKFGAHLVSTRNPSSEELENTFHGDPSCVDLKSSNVLVKWAKPLLKQDGSEFSELPSSYKVTISSSASTQSISLGGNLTEYTVRNLARQNTYRFHVTVQSGDGLESSVSNSLCANLLE